MEKTCDMCPRHCHADRRTSLGFCGMPNETRIARAALHFWEEPPVSGKRGSGTVFFCGCNLRCVFCQNKDISNMRTKRVEDDLPGRIVSDDELVGIMLRLRDEGAHNINLVTPTHYAEVLERVLPTARKKLGIPIVYNCGGYESVETLRRLEGLIDVYLPDFKYFSPELSAKYSAAPDYCEVAKAALAEMVRQTGKIEFDENGIIKHGVIVRHLVLPGCRYDSADVLRTIAETVVPEDIRISLMSQYTPDFAPPEKKELCRRITTFEYNFVLQVLKKYGFEGYFQEKSSADKSFTPDFREKTF